MLIYLPSSFIQFVKLISDTEIVNHSLSIKRYNIFTSSLWREELNFKIVKILKDKSIKNQLNKKQFVVLSPVLKLLGVYNLKHGSF